jgi:hypothetical protein
MYSKSFQTAQVPFEAIVKDLGTKYQIFLLLMVQCFDRYAAEVYFRGASLLLAAVSGSFRECATATEALRHLQSKSRIVPMPS